MRTARSARRTCSAASSAVEYTATASMPSSCSARITRTAISPRFATRTRLNTRQSLRIGPLDDLRAAARQPAAHRHPALLRVPLDVDGFLDVEGVDIGVAGPTLPPPGFHVAGAEPPVELQLGRAGLGIRDHAL